MAMKTVSIEVHPDESSMNVSGRVSMQGMLYVVMENGHDHQVQVRKLEVSIKLSGEKPRNMRLRTESLYSEPPLDLTDPSSFAEGIMLKPKETKSLYLCFSEKGDFSEAYKNLKYLAVSFRAVGEPLGQKIRFNPVSWERAKQGGSEIKLHGWRGLCR